MDNSKIVRHISVQFNKELEAIRTQVLTMGSLVEQQLELAMAAFTTGDFKLAEKGIKLFNQVYAIKLALDQQCTQTLALRQPAAFDLRFLITVIKIIYELEMISELAEYIAKMTIQLSVNDGKQDAYSELINLSKSVKVTLHSALDAFARINVNAIAEITGLDEHVNGQYTAISRKLISQMMEDPQNIRHILDVSRAARALERIGYHSFHIYEELIYMVNGGLVKHFHTI
ncbi:MAG: phosphate signaling complex protein PhoU [Methylococcales bacterium]